METSTNNVNHGSDKVASQLRLFFGRWYYSIGVLTLYIATFVFWKYFPSRPAFIYGGLVTAGVMTLGMLLAQRRRYFASRVDLAVHAYVILDVLLEGIMYEGFRWMVGTTAIHGEFVHQFHDNNNFYLCALTFAVLIGGNRWYALHQQRATHLVPASSQGDAFSEEALTVAG